MTALDALALGAGIAAGIHGAALAWVGARRFNDPDDHHRALARGFLIVSPFTLTASAWLIQAAL